MPNPLTQLVDRGSPVPLYHQIAEAFRWRISTGQLTRGMRLPAVRTLGSQLGVNLHTVRQAYGVLADEGLIRRRGARGTIVLGGTPPPPGTGAGDGALDAFLGGFLEEAGRRFALTPEEAVAALQRSTAAADPPDVHVVECSQSQCRDHCAELGERWRVRARPFSLERQGEPPPGPIVATYFHYAEVRNRWPHRLGDLRFVPIQADPSLPARLAALLERHRTLFACELEPSKAHNLRTELSLLLPAERVAIETLVVGHASEALAASPADRPVLFAPRVWAQLDAAQQRHPRAHQARFTIEPAALDRLGVELGWRAAGHPGRSGARGGST